MGAGLVLNDCWPCKVGLASNNVKCLQYCRSHRSKPAHHGHLKAAHKGSSSHTSDLNPLSTLLQNRRAAKSVFTQPAKLTCHSLLIKPIAAALALAPALILLQEAPAVALTIHQEPENALSFPTWVIHISSVIEWTIAMALVWKYAEVTGRALQMAGMHLFSCDVLLSTCILLAYT